MASVDDLCPRRGPGLRHHADASGILCSECGALLTRITSVNPTAFDVAQRLQALGLLVRTPAPGPTPDAVEEKWISGHGPTGWPHDLGRGDLNKRQIAKLEFLSWLRQRGLTD